MFNFIDLAMKYYITTANLQCSVNQALYKINIEAKREGVHLTLPRRVFFRPSKVWSMFYYVSIAASSE